MGSQSQTRLRNWTELNWTEALHSSPLVKTTVRARVHGSCSCCAVGAGVLETGAECADVQSACCPVSSQPLVSDPGVSWLLLASMKLWVTQLLASRWGKSQTRHSFWQWCVCVCVCVCVPALGACRGEKEGPGWGVELCRSSCGGRKWKPFIEDRCACGFAQHGGLCEGEVEGKDEEINYRWLLKFLQIEDKRIMRKDCQKYGWCLWLFLQYRLERHFHVAQQQSPTAYSEYLVQDGPHPVLPCLSDSWFVDQLWPWYSYLLPHCSSPRGSGLQLKALKKQPQLPSVWCRAGVWYTGLCCLDWLVCLNCS